MTVHCNSTADAGDVAKRLSFGQPLAEPLTDVDGIPELIEALEHPSIERITSALQALEAATSEHVAGILHLAQDSAKSAEMNPDSLKQRIGIAKSRYQALNCQALFMKELIAGKPDGSEQNTAQEAHDHARQWGAQLKSLKSSNVDLANDIQKDVIELVALYDEIAGLLKSAQEHLKNLQAQSEQRLQEESQRLLEQEHTISELQKANVEKQALIAELKQAISAEEEELAALESEVGCDLSHAATTEHRTRAEWLQEATSILSSLTGVHVENVTEGTVDVSIVNETEAGQGGWLESKHKLRIWMKPGTTIMSGLKLEPSSVPLDDVEFVCAGKPSMLRYAVQEVCLRIAAHEARNVQLKEISAHIERLTSTENGVDLTVRVAGGHAAVQLHIPVGWPLLGHSVEITDVQAATGSSVDSCLHDLRSAKVQNDKSLQSIWNHADAIVKKELAL